MQFLIDTQILIWSIADTGRILPGVREILVNNDIYVSQISFFEISIKQSIHKLPQLLDPVENIRKQAIADGFQLLDIKSLHVDYYKSIPLFPDHRDPFDRLLIATAISEDMSLISSDPKFRLYSPELLLIENQI